MSQYFVWDYRHQTRENPGLYASFTSVKRKQWSKQAEQCRYCGAEIGVREWQGPFIVQPDSRPLGDVCGDGQNVLLSPRCQKALETERISGFQLGETPVEFVGYPEYRDYRVIRYSAIEQTLDDEASQLEIEHLYGCEYCRLSSRKRISRVVLGNPLPKVDIFRPSCLYSITMVSSRFVEATKRHHLVNFRFISQDDYFEPKTYDFK